MKRKVTWQVKIMLLLAILVLVGFIQWESWFPLEIKDNTLREMADYGIGFSALFLLTIVGFSVLAQRFPGKRRMFLFVLRPILLICILYLGLIFSFITGLGGWQDYRIYRNGNSYLVLEMYEAPGDMEPEYSDLRLIITKSPLSMVRWNDAVYTLSQNKDVYVKAEKILQFAGKTWYTVADF